MNLEEAQRKSRAWSSDSETADPVINSQPEKGISVNMVNCNFPDYTSSGTSTISRNRVCACVTAISANASVVSK